MARRIMVEIVGDSKSVERAFERSGRAAQKFDQQVSGLSGTMDQLRVRSRRAQGVGPFRLGAAGLGLGVGLVAATQAVSALRDALETTGAAAFTTEGRLKNMGNALLSGNIVGAIQAWRAQPKTLEEAGLTAIYTTRQFEALEQVAAGAAEANFELGKGGRFAADEFRRMAPIVEAAGTASKEMAQKAIEARDALYTAQAAADALSDSVSRLGQNIVTQSGAIVTFKGHVDDLAGPRGPGARAFEIPQPPGFGRPTLPPTSPSQRRELALIGLEGMGRLPGLRDRLRQLNNQMKDFHGNQEQRLRILTNIARTRDEIAGILADQAAKAKAAAKEQMETRLGWLEFAVERAEATETVRDDVKALRAVEKFWLERIRREGRVLEFVRELWRTRQRIRDLGKKDGGGDPLAGLMQASTKQLTRILAAGTGLGAGGRRVLGANISGLQMRPVYVSVQMDGREVGRAVTKQQARTSKRTARQTSGHR